MNKTREQAFALLKQYVESPLIKHCLAVEAAMRGIFAELGV